MRYILNRVNSSIVQLTILLNDSNYCGVRLLFSGMFKLKMVVAFQNIFKCFFIAVKQIIAVEVQLLIVQRLKLLKAFLFEIADGEQFG